MASACGDDDDDGAGDAGGDAPPVYTITASESGEQRTFTVPSDMKGGVITIRLQNGGQGLHDFQLAKAVAGHTLQELLAQQLHHALLVPVAAGKTFATAKEALLSEEEPEGPPPVDFENAIATPVVNPGGRMVTKMRLTKGTYVVVCFLPDKGTAGPPHATKGMLTELKVG